MITIRMGVCVCVCLCVCVCVCVRVMICCEIMVLYVHVILFTALAVFARSPAAYSALKSFRLFQLQSEAVLKKYRCTYKESAGEGEARLIEEREMYQQQQEEARSHGRPVPFAEGALIFDEVKVQAKLQWNSRDHSLIGYAMTKDDMASLSDIFRFANTEEFIPKTDYILQTLWRDHSSNCDIIGPYYTSNGTMTSSFTFACITDAMRKFHAYGIKVYLSCFECSSHTHTHTHMCVRANTHAHTHKRTYTPTHACTHIHTGHCCCL